MVVSLIYNIKGTLPDWQRLPQDLEAEYQDEEEVGALQEAIRASGFEVVLLPGDSQLPSEIQTRRVDMAFNVAEGWGGRGRESFVPALLDMLDIPYTGSDALTLGVSLDKALTKMIAQAHGLPTPSSIKVDSADSLRTIALSFPLFVKPNGEGSSMGIGDSALVENPQELQRTVTQIVNQYKQPALVEQFMEGREFTVGLLGNGEDLQTFPVLEIVLPEGARYYRYEQKSRHEREICCPAAIPESLADEMTRMAVVAFTALECCDFARVDFMADHQGKPHFLEINPLPGLHPENSLYPQQAYAAGLSYDDLIGRIIEVAMARYRITKQETWRDS